LVILENTLTMHGHMNVEYLEFFFFIFVLILSCFSSPVFLCAYSVQSRVWSLLSSSYCLLDYYSYLYFLCLIRGKQWQTTPKNLPRMQHTRAIPVDWLSSGLCPNRPKGWIPIIIIIIIIMPHNVWPYRPTYLT